MIQLYIYSPAGKVVDVCGYDPSTTSRKLQIVTAALAYDRPTTGRTIILILHVTISYLNVHKPTTAEYADCEHINLTADAPTGTPAPRNTNSPKIP